MPSSQAPPPVPTRAALDDIGSIAPFSKVFDVAPTGMALVIEEDLIVAVANQAFCRLLGRDAASVRGSHVSDVVHVEDLVDLAQGANRVITDVAPTFVGTARLLAAGGPIWTEVRLSALPAIEGDPRIFVVQVTDITERLQHDAIVAHQAMHDDLTGLPNRLLLADRLRHALARRTIRSDDVAVMAIDLDRFTLVNETFGQTGGDMLLRIVGERIATVIGPADTVARVGSDEFVVLCEAVTGTDAALTTAQSIAAAIGEPLWLDATGGAVEILTAASVGVTVAGPTETDAAEILREADAALHRVKGHGGGQIHLYDRESFDGAVERLRTENALRDGIQRDELFVLFQPAISFASGRIAGVEALARWTHPQRGLVLPDEFIPLAEECGLIDPIGRWVLREACRAAAGWSDAVEGPLDLAVNVSARQLRDDSLVDAVVEALADSGMPPERLCLEVTETALMDDRVDGVAMLQNLKDLGVRIALDDFGTGWSSLAHLRDVPLDVVKIDRTFVRSAVEEVADQEIVRSVIQLGHALGLAVVAEGIEDDEQHRLLADLGCDQWQGYLCSVPVSDAELAAMLDRQEPTGTVESP
ncbi:MAG TPA: bifunctional diguanylate cyclase/phosphodiesterase [Acidimicrobiales bacterium]|nr:bifunctional diguanylate cyclase/phosphodiesterase [Acidimicrobiales bacterium]